MTVEKRRGRWAYRFMLNGETYFKGGFPTAAEAEKQEEELRFALEESLTFSAVVRKRLAHVKAYCSKTHYRDSKALLKPFERVWGPLPISTISREMVSDRILELAEYMSNHNTNRHIKAIRSLFNLAEDEWLINRNPAKGLKLLPHKARKKILPHITHIKEVLMRANAEERAYLMVALCTGARIGEINQLAWENVDFHEGIVYLSTRKTKGGHEKRRKVPMIQQVRSALEYMWGHRVPESPWVFTSSAKITKYPDDPDRWHYGYRRKLLRRLGAAFSYHHLRHFCSSLLVSLGVELTVIQTILGHGSPTTTDRYLQSLPANVVTGMGKLEDFLGVLNA